MLVATLLIFIPKNALKDHYRNRNFIHFCSIRTGVDIKKHRLFDTSLLTGENSLYTHSFFHFVSLLFMQLALIHYETGGQSFKLGHEHIKNMVTFHAIIANYLRLFELHLKFFNLFSQFSDYFRVRIFIYNRFVNDAFCTISVPSNQRNYP